MPATQIVKTDARDGNWYVYGSDGECAGTIIALHHGSSKTTAWNQAESAATHEIRNFESIHDAADWIRSTVAVPAPTPVEA